MRQRLLLVVVILFLAVQWTWGGTGQYSFSGYLPRVEKAANQITINIDSAAASKEFYIYYRIKGIKNFQVRKMKRDDYGHAYYQLSTDILFGSDLEYFIVEDRSALSDTMTPVFTITGITDKESPDIYFLDAGQEGGGEESGPKDPLFFRIGASLSATGKLHDNADPPGEDFDANANLRIYKNIYKEKYQFDFDSNFTYTHNAGEEEEKINLSNMSIKYVRGTHTIEAGDLSVNGTDFTISSLSRRGVHYQMDGKNLYLSSFFTNSQQKTGFDGFGIPPSSAYLFGATAGFNLGSTLKVRGMFMTGKDNQDSKTLVTVEDAFREGDLYSLWGEFSLFQSKLVLKGEFSRSSFGKAQEEDNVEKESDTAWRAGASFNHGIFSASGDYKKVGGDFSSIANLFLENDWEGLTTMAGIAYQSFSLNVSYTDRKTNITSTVQPMLRTKNIMAMANWLIANHIQVGAEFGLDNLDYDKSSGMMTGTDDMDTIKYAGTLGYIAGANGITLKLGKTESKSFTSNIDAAVALNLKFGNILSLNPTLSYQSTENFTDNSTSKVYNVFLNSELTIIQELFSFSFTGSWTKNDNTFMDSTMLSLGGNANLNLTKLFNNKIQPTLSLRGKYEEYKNGDTENDNVSLYLQADVSF